MVIVRFYICSFVPSTWSVPTLMIFWFCMPGKSVPINNEMNMPLDLRSNTNSILVLQNYSSSISALPALWYSSLLDLCHPRHRWVVEYRSRFSDLIHNEERLRGKGIALKDCISFLLRHAMRSMANPLH